MVDLIARRLVDAAFRAASPWSRTFGVRRPRAMRLRELGFEV